MKRQHQHVPARVMRLALIAGVLAVAAGLGLAYLLTRPRTVIEDHPQMQPSPTLRVTAVSGFSVTETVSPRPTSTQAKAANASATGTIASPTQAAPGGAATEMAATGLPATQPGPDRPTSPPYVEYTVRRGDTLSKLASENHTSVEAIQKLNALPDTMIYAGQKLLIPTGPGAGQPAAPNSPTQTPAASMSIHRVGEGETVASIAAQVGVSEEALRAANSMVGNALLPGQQILVPQAGAEVSRPSYRFSPVTGIVNGYYPGKLNQGMIILHYKPGTFAAVDPQAVAQLVERSLQNAESLFGRPVSFTVHAYAVGSVFAPPEQALRGKSVSVQQYYFFLHDGTGNAADQQYIAAHELTHVYAWNLFGQPVSAMLSEGLAVYAGKHLIQDSDQIPLGAFCKAYQQAGALPRLSSGLNYDGHIVGLANYYTAGCFVQYLLETYGVDAFAQLYPTGNYAGIYGKNLSALEDEWLAKLAGTPYDGSLDPQRLVSAVDRLSRAYTKFFANFYGQPEQLFAYRALDQARLALLEGRLDDFEQSILP